MLVLLLLQGISTASVVSRSATVSASGNETIAGTSAVASRKASVSIGGKEVNSGTSSVVSRKAAVLSLGTGIVSGSVTVVSRSATALASGTQTSGGSVAVATRSATITTSASYSPAADAGTSSVTSRKANVRSAGGGVIVGDSSPTSKKASITLSATYVPLTITGTSTILSRSATILSSGQNITSGFSAIASLKASVIAVSTVTGGLGAIATRSATISGTAIFTPRQSPPEPLSVQRSFPTWGAIYNQCCRILLEDPALQLGLLTDAQFYSICTEVWVDFCAGTRLAKRIFNTQTLFAIGTYKTPTWIVEIDSVVADEKFLYQTSDFFLSNATPDWQNDLGQPQDYREDNINPNAIQIHPAPDFTGNQVNIAAGQGGYGVISSVQAANDFTVLAPNGAFGTPALIDGQMYPEVLTVGLGVIASMDCSRSNIEVFGTAIPFNIANTGPTTPILLIPDTFIPYLKYGVLARIFSSDSELKSEAKAKYADIRYQEGVSLLAAIMGADL